MKNLDLIRQGIYLASKSIRVGGVYSKIDQDLRCQVESLGYDAHREEEVVIYTVCDSKMRAQFDGVKSSRIRWTVPVGVWDKEFQLL